MKNLSTEDQLKIALAIRDIVTTTMDVDNIESLSEVRTDVLDTVNKFLDGLEENYQSTEEALSQGLLLYNIE